MDPARPGPLRIYRADAADSREGSAAPGPPDPHLLATRELLRSPALRPGHRELEPFSRAWFEELEHKRYAAHGSWLRRVLEFSRHPGESLLMVGAGLGSDALQYHRHGTPVTLCATPSDHPELVQRNFELRGQSVRVVHMGMDLTVPFDRWAFDLAYVNALYAPPMELPRIVNELYRVLKPGGKAFVLAPARYDAVYWQDLLIPFHHWYRPTTSLTDSPRFSARALKQAFAPFSDHKVVKRHLRRSELPYVCRFLPLSLLERVVGRVLVLRAFKPVSAALEQQAMEPAA